MKADFFSIYDALIDSVTADIPVVETLSGDYWTAVSSPYSTGLAMTTRGSGVPPMFPNGILGLGLFEAAQGVKSWNLEEAGFGLAAINCCLNTPERIEALNAYEPFENYCTQGIDFKGKTVGLIGHLRGPEEMRRDAKQVYILERAPQPGDYPDSACDWILPQCDIVLITGSSLVNKTLPHLLDCCENAYKILVGPSVPLCPALLELGLDRIAGMAVTDADAMKDRVRRSLPGSPYPHGMPFLLKK